MANNNAKKKSSSAAEFNRMLAAIVLLAAGAIGIIAGIYNVTDSDYRWYKSFLEKTEKNLAVVSEGDYDPAITLQYNDYIAKYTKKIADRKTAAAVFAGGGACAAAAGTVIMVTGNKKKENNG